MRHLFMKNSVKFIILIIITRMGLNFANSEEMNIWPQFRGPNSSGVAEGFRLQYILAPGITNYGTFHLILDTALPV